MGLESMMRAFLLMVTLFFSCSCSNGDEPSFLDDRAGLLSSQQKEYLNDYNNALLKDLDIHFKLIILAERAEDINETAAVLFGDLGLKTGGARGLLFLVDPLGKQARIEVGYDLEGVFPDAFVGYIENKQMVPFFAAGRTGTGVAAATELFVSRVQWSLSGQGFDPFQEIGARHYFSGGGGARVSVAIGSGKTNSQSVSAEPFLARASPEETLHEYMRVLRQHEKNPQLELFTPETREFFKKWLVTDGQQDNELRSLERAVPEKVIIAGEYAVIRYPVGQRTQAPYFLKKGADGWMLDFWTMSQVLQMNHENNYHFKRLDHPYRFAFADWQFDQNGFPVVSR